MWAGRGGERCGFCRLQRVRPAQTREGLWAQGRVRAVAQSAGEGARGSVCGLSKAWRRERGTGPEGWFRGRVLRWPLFLRSREALLPLDRGLGACQGPGRGGSEEEGIQP